ncbi:MAG: DUF4254 domain-containing protein [Desulfovibrionales bacterium]|nr:DUF4254 domain-containing protein [Desulfovibrionales bacterium]
MTLTSDKLREVLAEAGTMQRQWVARWHEPDAPDRPTFHGPGAEVLTAILLQHRQNFLLWHVEDRVRRHDVTDAVITRCKRDIDALNQQRNDLMEEVDALLVQSISVFPAQQVARAQQARYNTETLGAALDRLSILSLKIFHMHEQTQRRDVDADHVARCAEKVRILEEQHQDLAQAIGELVDEYAAGIKRPKVYYQCKMYNDPTLNPELYNGGGVGSHT